MRRSTMNAFVNHHRDAIRFDYSCFDRIILGGYVGALQIPGQVASFLRHRRQFTELSKSLLTDFARQYRLSIEAFAHHHGLDILEPDSGQRREDLVGSYWQHVRQPGVAVIVKAREPERIAVCQSRGHIDIQRRWVMCYTFYLHDADCGRMSLRVCPYFLGQSQLPAQSITLRSGQVAWPRVGAAPARHTDLSTHAGRLQARNIILKAAPALLRSPNSGRFGSTASR